MYAFNIPWRIQNLYSIQNILRGNCKVVVFYFCRCLAAVFSIDISVRMATLEQRLEDSEYKFWVKAGICLGFVKNGLEIFADERSKKIHGFVKTALNNNSSINKMCSNANIFFNKRRSKWTTGCCGDCEVYVDELVNFQSSHFKLNQTNWKNSEVQLWPVEAWEMMKVYMNPGQKPFQKTPADTDLSGLINFIDHCTVPRTDIQNTQNISKVIIQICNIYRSHKHTFVYYTG